MTQQTFIDVTKNYSPLEAAAIVGCDVSVIRKECNKAPEDRILDWTLKNPSSKNGHKLISGASLAVFAKARWKKKKKTYDINRLIERTFTSEEPEVMDEITTSAEIDLGKIGKSVPAGFGQKVVHEDRTRRVQLVLGPELYQRSKLDADGRKVSFNEYVNSVLFQIAKGLETGHKEEDHDPKIETEIDEISEQIGLLMSSMEGQALDRRLQTIDEIRRLSQKRAELREQVATLDESAKGTDVEDLRIDATAATAALESRIDAIEAKFTKAVYDLWMSHVNTLDALSDRFIPNVNSLANGLRVGAELDAKNAGFALPCKEDRRKMTETGKKN